MLLSNAHDLKSKRVVNKYCAEITGKLTICTPFSHRVDRRCRGRKGHPPIIFRRAGVAVDCDGRCKIGGTQGENRAKQRDGNE
jgi:hypothetical protein